MAEPGGYDAFISYSHAADGQLAPALRSGLEQLARPWRRRRALRVFQDSSGLAATPGLWSTIQEALDRSRSFILLASPAAASSAWVQQEIDHFRRTHGTRSMFLALTDGFCQWDPGRRDFDWAASTALPRQLSGAFAEEPLFVDLRWARSEGQLDLRNPRFRNAVGDLAAPLHGVARDELDALDLVQYRRARRARRVATTGIAGLAVLATVAGSVAVLNAAEARAQQRSAEASALRADRASKVSEAGRLAAISSGYAAPQTDLALLLALHSLKLADTREGRLALATAMTRPAASSAVLPGTSTVGLSLAVGRSGQLASGGGDGDVLVWERAGAGKPQRLSGHRAAVTELSFASDESLLASVDLAGRTLVQRPSGGAKPVTLDGVADAVFRPGTVELAVVGLDGAVALLDGRSGERLWQTPAVGPASTSSSDHMAVAASPDGKTLAVASPDRRIVLLAADTGRRLRTWRIDGSAGNDVTFDPSSTVVAAGGDDGVVRSWQATTGTLLHEFRGNQSGIRRVSYGLDGRTIASGGLDARLRIYDVGSERIVGDLAGHNWGVSGVAFAADGHTLLSSAPQDGVRQWNVDTGRPRWVLTGHRAPVIAADFTTDSTVLATLSTDRVMLWHPDRDEGPFASFSSPGYDLDLTPDGRTVVVAGFDGRVHLHDTTGGRETGRLGSAGEPLWSVSVSPDGRQVAAVDSTGVLRTWALGDGRQRLQQRVLPAGAARVRFSPDGARLAAVGEGSRVVLLEAGTGRRLLSWAPPGDPGRGAAAVAFSPDGSRLAVGLPNGWLYLLDVRSGAVVRSFAAHQNKIYALAFSPDSSMLATAAFNGGGISVGGFDGGLRLWDLLTGQQVGELVYHDSQVETVAFSPDGQWLVSGGADREVLLWSAYQQWRRRACQIAGRELTDAEKEAFLKPADRTSRVC
ncbi:TIR domain-containing protein [Microlunatus panaciterrae]|uniref:WD40 repeat protein n=1 Tax=Microlunatus panaciterrae TaxID=400768 RepID=A0ABS2RMP5_9ACTN|nr:PQQ-binding-like beta-propeller repeat protein [Microlunatus panaciterrae]MBM7800285.1 WD40 repeat protein [Microlunatus panaciterrae]